MIWLEVWDNLIQLAVTFIGGVYLLALFSRTGKRCFVFLSGAQLGWALGLVYYTLYIALRGFSPPELNPSQFVWSGAHLFYLSVIHSLSAGKQRGPFPWQAYLAAAVTLPFTYAWFRYSSETGGAVVGLVWGLGFMWIAMQTTRSLVMSLRANQVWEARYHALVLCMMLFDELVLFTGLFYTPADYHRLNWYYLFDLMVTLMLGLQVVALKKAQSV